MLALTHPVQGLRDGEWGIADEPGLVRSPLQKASPCGGPSAVCYPCTDDLAGRQVAGWAVS